MTRKLLTVDEFRAEARDDGETAGTVLRLAVADPEVATDSRKVKFVFSDGTIDRAGDRIDPAGWQTDSFMKNPVALWSHDSFSPPIGRASNVGQVGDKLKGDIEFMAADINPFAESVYRMVKEGFVKAVSVGFIPLEWSFAKDSERPYGIDFKKQELLEISVCPVPCNPNALQEAKALGIDVTPIRQWAERLLDEGGHVLIPRNLLEETFRQAKTPRAVRQQFLAKSQTTDWKVGAARDLPLDNSDSWDGPAAAKRMLDAAGFDGDKPDAAKAKRGFLIHDAANPDLRGSYKLPFADVVGGTLKAVKRGVEAAEGRLNQTDAPKDVLSEAGAVLDHYKKRFGDDSGKAVTSAASSAAPQNKSGRRISAANEAKLQEALSHHDMASQCIKDVLASNAAADDPDNDGDTDNGLGPDPDMMVDPPMMPDKTAKEPIDPRAARLAEAKALKASLGI